MFCGEQDLRLLVFYIMSAVEFDANSLKITWAFSVRQVRLRGQHVEMLSRQ